MKKRIQVKTEKPQFTVITNLTYAQRDSWFGHTMQDLKMDLIYPEDNSRTYPCIVWICGGAWLQLDKSAHLAYLSELSRKGFVVASVQYRTSNETPLPGQIQDVKAGIRYLRAHAERFHINPEKFGVMGESAGGYLTCMVALATDPAFDVGENLEFSSSVQAACPWYPPTDFRGFPTIIRSSAPLRRNPFSWGKCAVPSGGSPEKLPGELCHQGCAALPDHPRGERPYGALYSGRTAP
ncbi:MAG: alpha/beta hydrolase fold domain-containing protein [Lachnospiraceae bacterium]